MDYPSEMDPKHFSVLVLINAKKRICFNHTSPICSKLWAENYIIITLTWDVQGRSMGKKSRSMAVIGEKGRQLLSRYSPKELIEVSLTYHDVVGAAHYVHQIINMGQLPEFLTHEDGIIRQAARYRVQELKRGMGPVEPIMSVTLPSGW